MSDFNSSLPVRTESAGDVAVKIVDATITSQQLAVNADGSINITDNAGSITVDGTVELGATSLAALESITVQNGSGGSAVNIQDGGNSITVDGTVELGATSLAALESITVQNGSGGSAVNIQDGGNSITVDATALDIRALSPATDSVKISDGTDSLAVNADGSINVVVTSSVSGTPVCDFNQGTALAAAASSNHDYTVTTATTLKLTGVLAAASGKMKVEVQTETGVATGVFNTKFVGFNSTATPNVQIFPTGDIMVAAGVRVRVIRTNLDKSADNVYSTIEGSEF
jgi:hypothetical protein